MWQQWNAGKHKNREEMHTLGIWLETWEKWKTGSNSDHHSVRLRTEKYLRIHITSSLEADWLQYHKTTSCSASFSQEQKCEAVSGTGSPTLDSWRLEKCTPVCSQFLLRHRGSMLIIQAPLIQINHWLSVVAFLSFVSIPLWPQHIKYLINFSSLINDHATNHWTSCGITWTSMDILLSRSESSNVGELFHCYRSSTDMWRTIRSAMTC